MKRNIDDISTNNKIENNDIIKNNKNKMDNIKKDIYNKSININMISMNDLDQYININISEINNCKNVDDIIYIHNVLHHKIYDIEYYLNRLKQKKNILKNIQQNICNHKYEKIRDFYDSYHECTKCGDIK